MHSFCVHDFGTLSILILSAMPTITIRKVPGYVHKQLKRQARGDNRSLNGEVLQLLEEAVLGSSDENRRAILQELKSEQKRTPS